jgi:hypothetical protein
MSGGDELPAEPISSVNPDSSRHPSDEPDAQPAGAPGAGMEVGEKRQPAATVHPAVGARARVKTTADLPPLLTPAQAADHLQVTPQQIRQWRHQGVGPPWLRLSHRVSRYRRSDLTAWQIMQRE